MLCLCLCVNNTEFTNTSYQYLAVAKWLVVLSSEASFSLAMYTQTAEGSVNQLPPWTDVQGDIRLTPFYDIDECIKRVEDYVAELHKSQCVSMSL